MTVASPYTSMYIEYDKISRYCAWAPFYITLVAKVASAHANRIWSGTYIRDNTVVRKYHSLQLISGAITNYHSISVTITGYHSTSQHDPTNKPWPGISLLMKVRKFVILSKNCSHPLSIYTASIQASKHDIIQASEHIRQPNTSDSIRPDHTHPPSFLLPHPITLTLLSSFCRIDHNLLPSEAPDRPRPTKGDRPHNIRSLVAGDDR